MIVNYIMVILKMIMLVLLVVFMVKEFKLNKQDKYSIRIGILTMVSVFTANIPMLCFVPLIVLDTVWTIVAIKLHFRKCPGFYYITPIVICLISYTIGYLWAFGTVSFIVLFKIYEIILALLLFSYLFYSLTYLKFPFYKIKALIKKDKNFKMSNIKPSTLTPFLSFPILAMILL